MLAASAISIGWKRKSNCGTPKSNSAWNVERPIRKPPASEARRSLTPRSRPPGRERVPSASRMPWPISEIEAPPISIRWVGPHSVTSWPNRRCQTSSSGKPISAKPPAAAISTPPSGAYQPSKSRIAVGHGLLLRDAHREEAGGEDAEQAEEDQVVGRVGERARVAAVVDVQRDVPVHAEQRGDQRGGADRGGERDPRRQAADAARERGAALEQLRLAGAVAEAEREQEGGGDQRAAGGEHDLAEGGAARRGRLGRRRLS